MILPFCGHDIPLIHKIHYLPNAERMHYVLRHKHKFKHVQLYVQLIFSKLSK